MAAALCGIFAGLAAHNHARIALWIAFFVFWVVLLVAANRRDHP
jgi:hypothetical protein